MEKHDIGAEIRLLNLILSRRVHNTPILSYLETITGTNAYIIGYLVDNKDKEIYQKDIENEFGITRSTVSKVLKLMEQKGLIERQSVDLDRRLKKVVATPKSEEMSKQIEKEIRDLNLTLTRGISKKDLDTFKSVAEQMRTNLKESLCSKNCPKA